MEADEQWDGPEWILPYQGADPLYPPPPASDSKAEAEDEAEAGPRLKLHPYHLLFLLILYLRLLPSMMLDYSENPTRDAWREHDRSTWHYHHLRRWSIMVENLLPPRLQYKEPPYALPETL
ncbi:hypothetical protein Tco_1207945, partial [Tanacetum coccineum]